MWPSRKWWLATVVGLGTLATAFAQAGEWNSTLTIAAVGLVVQRASAWLVPNADEAPAPRVARVEGSRRAPGPRAVRPKRGRKV